MQEQQPQQQLLYQPLTFVYTQTIGSKEENKPVEAYDWKYRDIVLPKPILSQSIFFYYLFHLAPVYNWLRKIDNFCFEREQLRKYLQSPCQNTLVSEQNVAPTFIKQRLINYAKKWQIMKLCLKSKVQIKNSDKCRHLIKTELWSQYFTYNYKIQDFLISQAYCKECGCNVSVKAQIKQWAYAPIFSRYYGKQFNVKSQKYIIFLCYTKDYIYVRASNSLFYMMPRQLKIKQIRQVAMKLCSNFTIDKSAQGIFCYIQQNAYKDCSIMRAAQPIIQIQKLSKKEKIIIDNPPEPFISNKVTKKQDVAINHNSQYELEYPKNKQIIQKKQEDSEIEVEPENKIPLQTKKKKKKLTYLRQDHTQVILGSQTLQSKEGAFYKSEIEKLFYKPKQKDDYEKQYDQGKTKKIKKKMDYYKPNFNQIFTRLKEQEKEGKSEYQRRRNKLADTGQNNADNKKWSDNNKSRWDAKGSNSWGSRGNSMGSRGSRGNRGSNRSNMGNRVSHHNKYPNNNRE